MKKFNRYFDDLFKRFDIWLFFISIVMILFAFYRRDLSDVSSTAKYLLASLPILVIIGNIGNFKKHTTILDVFSIVLFFVYLYFAILDPQIYTILIPCLLAAELLLRIAFYSCEEEEVKNASKLFYAHLNYRFPLLVMIVLGISLAFGGYYIILNGSEQLASYFETTLFVCSTLIPLIYLSMVSLIDHRKIQFLDYVYFMFFVFLVGTIFIFYAKNKTIYTIFTLILPYLILCLRAHTYEGDMLLKKKKYVSCLLEHYHTIAVFAIGFGLVYMVAFSSVNSLFDLHQNIYLAIVAGVCVLLCILLLCMRNLKAREIKPIDYVFFLLSGVIFFTFVYVLSVALDMYGSTFKKSFFEDLITLISLFILLICSIVFLILYFLRYQYFFKVKEEQEPLIEEQPVIAEKILEEESIEAFENSKLDSKEDLNQEEAFVKEEKIEEESVMEQITPTPVEEPVVLEPVLAEEIENSFIDEKEEEEPLSQQTLPIESGDINIVVPDDVSQNHLTKVKYFGKLMFSDEKIKGLYSEVKNYLMSYGATSRIASTKETFKKKGTVAIVRLVGKALNVYLAILPEPFLEENYHIKDMQGVKQYEETPSMIKIKTKRSLKEFKEIVDVMMIHKDIKKKAHYKKVDFEEELIPNGEAILNALGYSSDYLVPSISAKIIPNDMPTNLEQFVPSVEQASLKEDATYTPVYLDTLCNYYENDAVIRRENLIEKRIIKATEAIVIKSRGTLDKRLTIYADLFESDALKMIYITNGKAIKINHSSQD